MERIRPLYIVHQTNIMLRQMLETILESSKMDNKPVFLSILYNFINEIKFQLPYLCSHPCYRLMVATSNKNDTYSFRINIKEKRYISQIEKLKLNYM